MLGIKIKEGYSYWNFAATILVYFFSNSLTLYLLAHTNDLLTNKDYFAIDSKEVAKVSSDLNFYALPFQILMTFVGGFLYDIFGRRITIFISFFGCGISCFFVPYTYPNIYPSLLIVKILFTSFLQPTISNPLINDYITEDSRGRAFALKYI